MLNSGDIIKERNRSLSATPLSSTITRSARLEKDHQRLDKFQNRRNSFNEFSNNDNEFLPVYSATFSKSATFLKSADNHEEEKSPSDKDIKEGDIKHEVQKSIVTPSKTVIQKTSSEDQNSTTADIIKIENISDISFDDLRDNIKKDKMNISQIEAKSQEISECITNNSTPQQLDNSQITEEMSKITDNNNNRLILKSSSGKLTAIEQNIYGEDLTGTETNFENPSTAYTDNRIVSNPSISANNEDSNSLLEDSEKKDQPLQNERLNAPESGAINAISPPTPHSNSNGVTTSSAFTNNSHRSFLNSAKSNNNDNLILESVDVMEKLHNANTLARSPNGFDNIQNINTKMISRSSDFISTPNLTNQNDFDDVPFFNENSEAEKSKKKYPMNPVLNSEYYDDTNINQLRSTSVIYNPIGTQNNRRSQELISNNDDKHIDSHNSSNNEREKSSTDSTFGEKSPTLNLKKPKDKRFGFNIKNILFIIVAVLLIGSISAFIPLIVIFSRGTESTFYKYFERQSLDMKELLMHSLKDKFNTEENAIKMDFTSNLGNPNGKKYPVKVYPFGNNDVEFYTRTNFPGGLLSNYSEDNEIVNLMNYPGLCNVFYGIDYAPKNVIHPICGINERDVMSDLALLSQVTTKIRTYGMQCNQQSIILDSIQKLGLNMTLSIGVWIGNNEKVNANQIDVMKSVLKKYPRELFDSIYMGDESIFREEMSSKQLSEFVLNTKEFVRNELKWLDLPVGTSEIGNLIDKSLMNSSDIIGANIHPFFSGESVSNATKWIFDYVKYQIEPVRQDINATTNIVISEVGWPSGGGNFSNSVAGISELQSFLTEWIPTSHKQSYPWFWFEAFDEPWKHIYNTDGRNWETEWGIFTFDRKLKAGITLPGC